MIIGAFSQNAITAQGSGSARNTRLFNPAIDIHGGTRGVPVLGVPESEIREEVENPGRIDRRTDAMAPLPPHHLVSVSPAIRISFCFIFLFPPTSPLSPLPRYVSVSPLCFMLTPPRSYYWVTIRKATSCTHESTQISSSFLGNRPLRRAADLGFKPRIWDHDLTTIPLENR